MTKATEAQGAGFTRERWVIAEMHDNGLYLNDGAVVIMDGERGSEDRAPVAHVLCRSQFKRGEGYKAACPVRDARAHLIASAPALYEAAQQALLYIEADETAHGRTFGAGNALRDALAAASPSQTGGK